MRNTTQQHKQQWREEEIEERFPSWKYSHYFKFVSAKDENIEVCCSFKSTMSNLKKHLESQHS